MPRGTLEFVLISAKGVENNDFLSNIDPYVIIKYQSQEHKSTAAENGGSNPQWNQTFLLTVSDSSSELNLKIMDKDNFSSDDFLARQREIPLEAVFAEGSLPELFTVLSKTKSIVGRFGWLSLSTLKPREASRRRIMVDGKSQRSKSGTHVVFRKST